jgi:hypothetical protein
MDREFPSMTTRQVAAAILLLTFLAAVSGCKTNLVATTYPEGALAPANAAKLAVPAMDRAVKLLYVDFHKIPEDVRQVYIIPGFHRLVFRVGNHQNPIEDITVPFVFETGRRYGFRLDGTYVQGRQNPQIVTLE